MKAPSRPHRRPPAGRRPGHAIDRAPGGRLRTAGGSTAKLPCPLGPRWTRAHIRASVPSMRATPPMMTKETRGLSQRASELSMAALAGGRHQLRARPEDAGQRLDPFLAGALPELSRSRPQQLVREGCVSEGARGDSRPGAPGKGGRPLRCSRCRRRAPAHPRPEPRDARDPVRGRASDRRWTSRRAWSSTRPPAIAAAPWSMRCWPIAAAACPASAGSSGRASCTGSTARSSGVMVAAKHDRAHVGLAGQFSVHTIDRVYEAVVWGVPGARRRHDRPADRPPSERPQAHGDRRARRQAGRDPLAAHRGGRHPRRPARGASSRPGGRTRSASICGAWAPDRRRPALWPAAGRSATAGRELRAAWIASCCMPVSSASPTRSPAERLVFDAPAPPLFARRRLNSWRPA